jgi:DNA-binding MarR family transcriptional regulator
VTDSQADALRRHMQRMMRRFSALADDSTPCGKPVAMAHGHALMLLASRGELTQQQLGAELCIDKSNVARLCAKMVDAGDVSQRPSETDGRSRLVTLTPRGRRLAAEVEAASRAKFGKLLAALPARERGKVVQALEVLVEAMEALPPANDAEES